MTIAIANALFRYFETLYNLNRNVVALCGSNVFDQMSEVERRVDEVVMSIPRLIPYSFNKKISDYEISATDGLMVFSNDLPFLSTDYENIFQKHKGCLVKAKKIRNKLEHEMHGAHIVSSGSGTITMFSVTYKVYEEDIDLCAIEIIDFVIFKYKR